MLPPRVLFGAAAALLMGSAAAQVPLVFPAEGQDAARQSMDDQECRSSASRSTGTGPQAAGSVPSPEETAQESTERLRGTMRGSRAAPAGELSVDAERAAQIGALASGRDGREAAADARNRSAASQDSSAAYYRAYGACMENRGYTVR